MYLQSFMNIRYSILHRKGYFIELLISQKHLEVIHRNRL
jgi:hypothetical protein